MNKLEEAVKYFAQKYYEGIPEISDIEFDSLIQELKSEYPESKLLTTTGWGYEPVTHLKKYNHSFNAGSLNKLHSNKIISGKERFNHSGKIFVTSKLDGASAVAYYESGKLVRILSRGDGTIGNDITKNLIHAIPNEIEEKWIKAIRGEIVVTFEDCKKVSGSHPRNVATGLSQSKDKTKEELSILHFVPYYIHEYDNNKISELELLTELGFESILNKTFENFNSFKTALSNNNFSEFFSEKYPIDGIVLTSESKESIAVKFEDEVAETKVLDITWQLSRTGRMVPVLEVEPTDLRGAIIKRVTANNATWILEKECGIGSIIEIVRANEVIPKCVSVLEKSKIVLPTNCPSCNSVLENHNKDLVCSNEECPSKTKQVIFNIFNCRNYPGIGPAVIDSVIDYFNLTTIEETAIFIDDINFYETKLLELLKPAKCKLFLELIKIVKSSINIKDLIVSANIKNLGNSASEVLEEISGDIESFLRLNKNDIENKLPTYLAVDAFINNKKIIEELITFYGKQKIEFKKNSNKKIGVTLTGKMSRSRNDMIKLFNSYSNEVVEVSIGNADYLVCNEKSNSSKFKAAEKKGIAVVTETEFLKIVMEN